MWDICVSPIESKAIKKYASPMPKESTVSMNFALMQTLGMIWLKNSMASDSNCLRWSLNHSAHKLNADGLVFYRAPGHQQQQFWTTLHLEEFSLSNYLMDWPGLGRVPDWRVCQYEYKYEWLQYLWVRVRHVRVQVLDYSMSMSMSPSTGWWVWVWVQVLAHNLHST